MRGMPFCLTTAVGLLAAAIRHHHLLATTASLHCLHLLRLPAAGLRLGRALEEEAAVPVLVTVTLDTVALRHQIGKAKPPFACKFWQWRQFESKS